MNTIVSDWPHTVASRSHAKELLAPAIARVCATRIDRHLAAGTEPWHSPVYAARCRRLSDPRSRRMLARSLERLVDQAEAPARLSLTSAVAPSRRRVREARPLLLMVASRLRGDGPVNPRGLAAIRLLLSDGAGPVYTHGHPDALNRALQAAADWLDAYN